MVTTASASTRPLGRSGISLQPLALGGNVFGWTIDEGRSFSVLDAFVDAGLTFIDTADVYSKWAPGNAGGESETIIGKWFKQSGKRGKVAIATKVGMELAPDKKGLSKTHILRSVDESLQRLQTDHIDLYQAHRDDSTVPLEETLEAFTSLVKAGKVKAIGASNYTAARLAEALEVSRKHGFARFESLQPEYNLYDRAGFEAELQPLVVEEEIGVISYYSLASGFLSGKYRTAADAGKSPRGGNIVKKYLNDRGHRILQALDDVAARYRSTPTAVSLAWLMAQPGVTAPIASATSAGQLQDLLAATKLNLDHAAIEQLTHASA